MSASRILRTGFHRRLSASSASSAAAGEKMRIPLTEGRRRREQIVSEHVDEEDDPNERSWRLPWLAAAAAAANSRNMWDPTSKYVRASRMETAQQCAQLFDEDAHRLLLAACLAGFRLGETFPYSRNALRSTCRE